MISSTLHSDRSRLATGGCVSTSPTALPSTSPNNTPSTNTYPKPDDQTQRQNTRAKKSMCPPPIKARRMRSCDCRIFCRPALPQQSLAFSHATCHTTAPFCSVRGLPLTMHPTTARGLHGPKFSGGAIPKMVGPRTPVCRMQGNMALPLGIPQGKAAAAKQPGQGMTQTPRTRRLSALPCPAVWPHQQGCA